jgi:ribonuclease R
LIKKHLSDKRIKELEGLLSEIAFHSSRMERRADDAEREVLDAMRVWFMRDGVGEEYEGMVVGVTPYGLRLRLKDVYVEGFVHVSYMTDDFYRYNERAVSLSGRNTGRSYRIGDAVKVRVDRVDMEEREILFGILAPPSKRK